MKVFPILLLVAAFSILTFTATHGEEIINGKKAKRSSLQYMVSVQSKGQHWCGGFLINLNYVLTAAHCNESDLTVVLGTHNIDPKRTNLRRYKVKSQHIHELYREHPGPENGFDIMLLKLSEKVHLNNDVKIAKLPKNHHQVKAKVKCQVSGWGQSENQKKVTDLLVVEVSTIKTELCKKVWAEKIQLPPNILCAGGYKTKSGACQADSGGPLVCKGVAVGIVSFNWNNICKYPHYPNVYTDISQYINWIHETIKYDT